jgi:hypothetical protein
MLYISYMYVVNLCEFTIELTQNISEIGPDGITQKNLYDIFS